MSGHTGRRPWTRAANCCCHRRCCSWQHDVPGGLLCQRPPGHHRVASIIYLYCVWDPCVRSWGLDMMDHRGAPRRPQRHTRSCPYVYVYGEHRLGVVDGPPEVVAAPLLRRPPLCSVDKPGCQSMVPILCPLRRHHRASLLFPLPLSRSEARHRKPVVVFRGDGYETNSIPR